MDRAPTILFGAFDRHNFGDLLFPHIAAALLPGVEPIFAGLAERDLRPFGGHRVRALAELAAEYAPSPRNDEAPPRVARDGARGAARRGGAGYVVTPAALATSSA